MQVITKQYSLKVKAVQENGTFSGYASVFGNVDSDGEVIDKGAFKRTLDHNKGIVPIFWQHDKTQPVGWNTEAAEDNYGLLVKGKFLMEAEKGRYAHSFVKTGLDVGGKPGLSIGFCVPSGGDYVKDGVRHFKEVTLKGYSVVSFAANDLASVTHAKAAFAINLAKIRAGYNSEITIEAAKVAVLKQAAAVQLLDEIEIFRKAVGL